MEGSQSMLSQSTSLKSRDCNGAGTELAVRPTLTLVPQPTVEESRLMGVPERRVCLGCRSFKCTTPEVCVSDLRELTFRPCLHCRGIGAVRLDVPGHPFIDCDDCDGLGLIELIPAESSRPAGDLSLTAITIDGRFVGSL